VSDEESEEIAGRRVSKRLSRLSRVALMEARVEEEKERREKVLVVVRV